MLRTCYFLKTLILRNGEKIKFWNKESKKPIVTYLKIKEVRLLMSLNNTRK